MFRKIRMILHPKKRENYTLDELKQTWMGKLNENCVFISAKEKENIEELKSILYKKVREIHTTRFPYNDFLYPDLEELK
jgi:GTP-binding protein HflX